MLLILASRHDAISRRLADRWGQGVELLTCEALSFRGWRYSPGSDHSVAVIGDRAVHSEEIEGVLTRLPWVEEDELVGIVPEDRSYVATEMAAFLAAWLTELKCPVLNRPTPVCLMGPHWRQERWILTASKLGIPVVPLQRSATSLNGASSNQRLYRSTVVNVIGGRCFGYADASLCQAALLLAKAAGVSLLRAHFSSPEADSSFTGADYWVDLTDFQVTDAIRQRFNERSVK
jgi:hypothetical protein